MSRVSPRSVFITGANRGLGFEMVKQLTELKDSPKFIFATYRKVDAAKDLLEFAKNNKSVCPLQFDVRDTDRYDDIVAKVSSIVGEHGLNCLINNAAILVSSGLNTVTRDEMMEVYEVNTVAPLLLTRAFVPLLRKGYESSNGVPFTWSSASVVNITSYAASISVCSADYNPIFPNRLRTVHSYRISKAALSMVTKLLSIDLKEYNILVVAIHPGWAQTDMGGPEAFLKVPTCISTVLSTFGTLTEENSGALLKYNGTPIMY